jgi:hypothetical protein
MGTIFTMLNYCSITRICDDKVECEYEIVYDENILKDPKPDLSVFTALYEQF